MNFRDFTLFWSFACCGRVREETLVGVCNAVGLCFGVARKVGFLPVWWGERPGGAPPAAKGGALRVAPCLPFSLPFCISRWGPFHLHMRAFAYGRPLREVGGENAFLPQTCTGPGRRSGNGLR